MSLRSIESNNVEDGCREITSGDKVGSFCTVEV